MIIYNVTVKVEQSIAKEWLKWLRDEHIPDVVGTGCFKNATVLRLLDTDETEGPTFAIQYAAVDKEAVDTYLSAFAGEMRKRGTDKWGDKFIAFRTLMEVIN